MIQTIIDEMLDSVCTDIIGEAYAARTFHRRDRIHIIRLRIRRFERNHIESTTRRLLTKLAREVRNREQLTQEGN